MASDEELAGQLADGEEAALAQLLHRYEQRLYGFLSRQTGGRDVDDIYQETWLRVVRAAPSFDPAKRFSTWLFQIAVNLCRDWHRRQRPVADTDPDTIPVEGVSDARLDAGRLLQRLSPEQREVLILRFYGDNTEAETAEILGIPVGTVKSRTHAALSKLSTVVEADR